MSGHQRVAVWASFALAVPFFVACGAVYPELRTPVRPATVGAELGEPPADVYFVYVADAVIPPKTRDGRPLNPDPFARVLLDEREILVTPIEAKNRRPTWMNQRYANYRIPRGQSATIEVWDDNPLNDHPICREVVRDITEIARERRRELNCDSGARVTIAVEHAHAVFGIGLYYELRGSAGVYVTRVAGESPAARAGLRRGDRIITIAGKSVASMDALGVRSAVNSNIRTGLALDVVSPEGKRKSVLLEEGPIYPVDGDDLALPQTRPTTTVFDGTLSSAMTDP